MKNMKNMKIDIFADGADIQSIKKLDKNPLIKGFTTNPTLMRQSGIKNYLEFAKNISRVIKKKPISLEVFSDQIQEMEQQALILSKISKNFNVKIPITNSKGLSTAKLIARLSSNGVVCNGTAIFTFNQIKDVMKLLPNDTKIILSIFAGRIADSGKDPEELLKKIKKYLKNYKNVKLLWASTREVFNIFQAARSGCDIITVPYGILSKFKYIGKNQTKFSLETVKMFKDDANKAGYKI